MLLIAVVGSPETSLALDKQGSAHGGDVEGKTTGFGFSGSAAIGASLYNPTYAARPDNTGLALFRYVLHADVDLIGRQLSIPVDLNSFTDRTKRGAAVFQPTELDIITGLTTTRRLGPGALEGGARVETDQPVDRGGLSQTYADARARYLVSLDALAPAVGDALADGDVSGYATLGVFAVNPTYAARPDNSGRALLRYALHVETSAFAERIALGLDGTSFTDRRRAFTPSELDFTVELIGRAAPFDLHLAYERDSPLDSRGTRPGYTQSFVYALLGWAFDAFPEPESGAAQPAPPSPE
ncbi:MAG TPA: hypothetical protein VHE30_25895 [Polyangiaceae bacterium]|nr:hypothetical protein [Polyangiaceae bacterium]